MGIKRIATAANEETRQYYNPTKDEVLLCLRYLDHLCGSTKWYRSSSSQLEGYLKRSFRFEDSRFGEGERAKETRAMYVLRRDYPTYMKGFESIIQLLEAARDWMAISQEEPSEPTESEQPEETFYTCLGRWIQENGSVYAVAKRFGLAEASLIRWRDGKRPSFKNWCTLRNIIPDLPEPDLPNGAEPGTWVAKISAAPVDSATPAAPAASAVKKQAKAAKKVVRGNTAEDGFRYAGELFAFCMKDEGFQKFLCKKMGEDWKIQDILKLPYREARSLEWEYKLKPGVEVSFKRGRAIFVESLPDNRVRLIYKHELVETDRKDIGD